MQDNFFKELDKCKSRLEIYNCLCFFSEFLEMPTIKALDFEFFNLVTFEVPELINALKEKYEFIETHF